MQLRAYLGILRRFWPIVVALPLLVALLSFLVALRESPSFLATADLIVIQSLPVDGQVQEASELRDQWGGTEYVIDDLPQVVASALFAQDVSATLQARNIVLAPDAVKGALSAAALHRTVTIQARAASADTAVALVYAAVETLRHNGLKYWGRTDLASGSGLDVSVLTLPQEAVAQRSFRRMLINTMVRGGLGLAAGIGLAFLLHYLDTRLRSRHDVEEWIGLPVVGTIPPE